MTENLLDLTTQIVAAYVSKNVVQALELPLVITSVYNSLARADTNQAPQPIEDTAPRTPAVSIKKSVTPEYIVCLEDGKKFKSLKRHLSASYGLTPEQYRANWNLPHDYPMVAPAYAAARSTLAKNMGLGTKGNGHDADRRAPKSR
jgi:predicted transcriptional regulator